ncbi:MAG: hypothetical protein ACLP1E_06415 [Acidimicrobiales bacterium]
MTAFAAPTRPGHRSASPLVPWRQMGWVIWRQNRATLAVVVALLGAASVYLYISGEQLHQQSSVYFAAGPQLSLSTALFQVIAPLIGVFVGAPLLARELETGTFRFTWTQGFGRARWAIATLAPIAIAVTVVVGAFGMLLSWAYGPRIGGEDGLSPLAGLTFDLRGVAVAGWVLLAFAIGVLAGLLIRRVVPAMFATVVAWTGLAVGAGFLRRYYEAPLVTTKLNPALSDWVTGQRWTQDGKPVSVSTVNQVLQKIGAGILGRNNQVGQLPGSASGSGQVAGSLSSTSGGVNPTQYLVHHGFALVSTYQPASRFWPFQWIEGGWLFALALLLMGTAVWLVHRRAA